MSDSPGPVRFWVDPTCPWAWQTSVWARRLRDEGVFSIEWALFSLELHAMPDSPWEEVTGRGGEALRALALARNEGGQSAFERLYAAIGARVHEQRRKISPSVVRLAAADAAMADIVDRAGEEDHWIAVVTGEHSEARGAGVFGVPTIQIGPAKPIFGPVFARAPAGKDSRTLWDHMRWLAEREDFYELKRLRDRKPGAADP